MDSNVQVAHHFEAIVDDTADAREFGKSCAMFMQAYNTGFGEADLEEDG
jgi:hypothetical protein